MAAEDLGQNNVYTWLQSLQCKAQTASSLAKGNPTSTVSCREDVQGPPMQVEDFYQKIEEMKEFVFLVIKISFNHFYHHKKFEHAKQLYDSLFPPRKPG
mmetsp:Transcript_13214/g.22416  ORF Transcript_13214/g.22416 Transcript_13214/m.22416 type:complete len:99 (-) Transcript_13214:1503-1799(-)